MKFISPNTTDNPIESRNGSIESCNPFRVRTIGDPGSSSMARVVPEGRTALSGVFSKGEALSGKRSPLP